MDRRRGHSTQNTKDAWEEVGLPGPYVVWIAASTPVTQEKQNQMEPRDKPGASPLFCKRTEVAIVGTWGKEELRLSKWPIHGSFL